MTHTEKFPHGAATTKNDRYDFFFPDHECAALKECMSMKTWGFFSKGTK